MKINRKLKKGFTLVELIVVIAIVAILAAVSVVSYLAFIKQANISSDTQLVKELNTVLMGDETLHGVRESVHETLEAVEEHGFIVERLTPTTADYDIVYDRANNRFALLDKDGQLVYGETGQRAYNYKADQVWRIATKKDSGLSEKFSNYLAESFEVPANLMDRDNPYQIKTGFDCGEHTESIYLEYIGGSLEQNVILRTQGGSIIFNKNTDSGTHIGFVTETRVLEVKNGTYREKGVVGRLSYEDSDGKIAFGNGAKIYCYMNKSGSTEGDVANLNVDQNARIFTFVNKDKTYESYNDQLISVDENGNVLILDCTHHDDADAHDLFSYGDYKYFICKLCGAWAKYDASEVNENPTIATETCIEFEQEGEDNPFDISPADIGIDVIDYGFKKSYQDNSGNWIHEIASVSNFKNIVTSAKCVTNDQPDQTSHGGVITYPGYNNQNTTFLVVDNISFGSTYIWNADEVALLKTFVFQGKLIGALNNTDEKATLSKYYLDSNSPKFDAVGGGMFNKCINCTFDNLIIDDFVFNNSSLDGVGFFGFGWGGSTAGYGDNPSVTARNIIFNNNCSMSVNKSAGAVFGRTRSLKNITFENIVNNSSIMGTYDIGGLSGSDPENNDNFARTFTITGCVFNGQVIATDSTNGKAGGFLGYHGTSSYGATATFTNCVMNGSVKVATNNGGFFSYNTAKNSLIFVNCSIGENAKLFTSDPANKTNNEDDEFNAAYSTKLGLFNFKKTTVSYDSETSISFGNLPETYNSISINVAVSTQPVDIATHSVLNSSSGYAQVATFVAENYDSITELKRVNRVGYFKPSDSLADPVCYETGTYNWDYDTFKLNHDLLGTLGYEPGYHTDVNGGYFLLANEGETTTYKVIPHAMTVIRYIVSVFNNGELVGTGTFTDMWASHSTLLQAYVPVA